MRNVKALVVLAGSLASIACSGGGGSTTGGGNGLTVTEDVTYRPETVVIASDKARAAVLDRSDDDASMLLDGSLPELTSLAPGRVLLLGNLALRKVTNVTMEGANLRVTSDPAALSDAIENGKLAWTGKLDWNGIREMQTNLPGSGINPQGTQPWSNGAGVSGTMGPWKYDFKGSVADDTLTITARIDLKGDATAWVEIKAEMQRPDVEGDVEIHDHVTENAHFATSAIRSKVTASWGAGINATSSASLNDILWLPIDLPIPIMGTVPLFFRVGANFAFMAGLVGRGTSAGGSFEWTFDGSSSVGGTKDAQPDAQGNVASNGTIGDGTNFMATGGSAIGIVVNAPRFGVSLGVPKVNELVYTISGVVQLDARASGPLGGIVPCKEFDITVKATHGIEGKLLGITLWKSTQDLGQPYTSTWSSPMGVKCGK